MADDATNDPYTTIDPLPEDNDKPFSHPDDRPKAPASDIVTDIDEDEAYQEGEASAAQKQSESDQQSAIGNYNPDNDQRKQD